MGTDDGRPKRPGQALAPPWEGTMGAIHMPPGFPAREINLVIADPKYMIELIREAEKALELDAEQGKLLPAGERKALPAPEE